MRADVFFTTSGTFAFGILLQTWFTFSKTTIVWFLFLAFVLAALWRRDQIVKREGADASRIVLLASVALLCVALGSSRLLFAEQRLDEAASTLKSGETVTLTGVIVREPEVREQTTQLFVRTDETLLLVRTDRYAGVAYGDTVTVKGKLEEPEPFATDLGRTFDYPGYLRSKGVTHIISFADIEVMARGGGNYLVEQLLTLKQRFIDKLELVIPEPQVGLAKGLLLGVKSGLGEYLETAFRTTGIIHIVVLSGYNVMLVITFVLYGLAFVVPFRARLVIGFGAILAFALIVGLSATVVRACVMASLLLLARFTGRTYAIVRALVLAGVAMLIVNPHLLVNDVGFQLSFVATLGLILLAPWVESRLARVPALLGAREFLTATVAVQLFVTPLLLYQIGEFSVVAVLVNVLVLPMVATAMLLTFITGVAGFVSLPLAAGVGYIAFLSLTYIIFVAEQAARLPYASFVVPQFPFYVVILCYLFIGFVIYVRLTRQRVTGADEGLYVEPKNEDLSQWTIIEESVLKAQLAAVPVRNTKAAEAKTSAAEELPVFFR